MSEALQKAVDSSLLIKIAELWESKVKQYSRHRGAEDLCELLASCAETLREAIEIAPLKQAQAPGWQENIKEWAKLADPISTPWGAGYEAARSWVMMQIASEPQQGSKT